MRIRPVGAHALLLDCTAPPDVSEAALVEAWRAELWRRRELGDLIAVEIVPAARTVLLDGLPDPTTTARQLSRWASAVDAATTRANQAATAATRANQAATAATRANQAATAATRANQAATRANQAATAATRANQAVATAAARSDQTQPASHNAEDQAEAEADTRAMAQARARARHEGAEDGGADVVVPVTFDGPDLPVVAEHWGVDVAAVRHRLTSTRFRVAFCGFAPGFPYLTGLPAELALPRLATPRPRVPAGSVALAGPYAGIYPGASPGGWQLVGRTDLVLFDVTADPPTRLGPGTTVRMVVA